MKKDKVNFIYNFYCILRNEAIQRVTIAKFVGIVYQHLNWKTTYQGITKKF